jgi:hypothetical protein
MFEKHLEQGSERYAIPALCSANRAPIRSENFRNLSAQLATHCSCSRINVEQK